VANKGNIDAGKIKMIAVADHQRLKEYPNVPTMEETMPGVTSITWMAVSAPPQTPKDITKKVSDAIAQGFKQPDMRDKILKLEANPLGTTPERMREMIQESTDIWGPVVKEAHISID
jgi:putative tricarboxylic transport membrane protein